MSDKRLPNWREIRHTLGGKRASVHNALAYYGPRTPKELADDMAWDKTSVRPRLTELLQSGLCRTTGRRDGEHVYRYVSLAEAEDAARALQENSMQTTLAL